MAYLLDPACLNHCDDARIDSGIQCGAGRHKPDFSDVIALESGAPSAMNLFYSFSSKEPHFDSANDFLRILRGNAGRRLAVEATQKKVERSGAPSFSCSAEAVAQRLGTNGSVRETF